MGEHSNGFENQYETSFRAIVEELFGGRNILTMVAPTSPNTTKDDADASTNGASKNGGHDIDDTDPQHAVRPAGKLIGNDDNPIIPHKKLLNVTIGQLSDRPFYYLRDYGEVSNTKTNDDVDDEKQKGKTNQPRSRIDRQITWLMKAQFLDENKNNNNNNNNKRSDDGEGGGHHDDDDDDDKDTVDVDITKLFQFDDEVSDHAWVTLDEYERMLYGRRERTRIDRLHDGQHDDNDEDEIDPSIIREFCHPTIVKLARLGLDLLKEDLLA